jgi:hypothetical protein
MGIKASSVTLNDNVDVGAVSSSSSTLKYPEDMESVRFMASFRINRMFDGAQGSLSSIASKDSRGQSSVDLKKVTAQHIMLYQTPVNVSYSQNWAKQEGVYGEYGGFEKIANMNSLGLIKEHFTTMSKTVIGGIAKAAWAGDMSVKTGVAVNPFLGVAYESPNLRTLTVPYVFEPKSRHEAQAVIDIIGAFKFHSAPSYIDASDVFNSDILKDVSDSLSLNQALLKSPNVFEISFLDRDSDTGRNKSLFKFGPAVCMDVNCNYASNGIWRALESGLPVSVELNLTFQEMEIITRDKIIGGW